MKRIWNQFCIWFCYHVLFHNRLAMTKEDLKQTLLLLDVVHDHMTKLHRVSIGNNDASTIESVYVEEEESLITSYNVVLSSQQSPVVLVELNGAESHVLIPGHDYLFFRS